MPLRKRRNLVKTTFMKTHFFCFCFTVVMALQSFAAGPIVVGNGAGSEENQYVSLWANRDVIFGLCLNPSVNCGLAAQEKVVLQKIALAAKAWKPFQFFQYEEFEVRSQGLIRPVKAPFLAYSKGTGSEPGIILFNISLMYRADTKYSYENKLFVLAATAADQAGVTSAQAAGVIQKLVAFWQQRWSKIDLRILSEPDVQIWIQQGPSLSMLLFDQQSVFDLAASLKNSVKCAAGNLTGVTVTSPFWSSYQKAQGRMLAILGATVTIKCSGGEVTVLNAEMDLTFESVASRWIFKKESLKVHLSSLN